MSSRVSDSMRSVMDQLRHQPTEKRIRAKVGDQPVVDSTRALLVWEPRRIVPTYAVPIEDVKGELAPASGDAAPADAPILHPGIPFSAHSTEGEPLDLHVAGEIRPDAAFRPADPDLAGHVVLDFDGFDSWYEEDELIFSHPRDPYHRVDVRRSSRPIRIELEGVVLAESARPSLAFETNLPVRFYIPPEDMKVDLEPTPKHTACPYKGHASYWSFDLGGRSVKDLAWTYKEPLEDAVALTGLVAFYDEVVDVVLDGERRERPDSPFAQALLEEFAVLGPGSGGPNQVASA